MDWNTVLVSGVLAALISAWVTKLVAERQIYAENITKERAKWRERIRTIAQEYPIACHAQRIKLELELVTRLNPYDPEDLQILKALRKSSNGNFEELSIRVSLLLKHDWERAKNEAKSMFKRRINPVRRLSYEQYMVCRRHYDKGDPKEFERLIKRHTY